MTGLEFQSEEMKVLQIEDGVFAQQYGVVLDATGLYS